MYFCVSLLGQNRPTCVTRDIYLDVSRVYSSRSAWRLKPSLVNQVHMKDNDWSGLLFLQNLKDFGLGIIIFVCNRWCFRVNRVGLQGCLMPLVKVGWVCLIYITYVSLEHKTSHKWTFLEIEIYASSESWINHISIDVWFGQYLKIWNLRMQKNLNIEKITFKVVQMKFLAMHINNQKLSFDIFMVRNVLNIFMEHDLNILMIFGIK